MIAFRGLGDVRPSACTALSEIAASNSSSDKIFCAVKVGTPKQLLLPNNKVGQTTDTFFEDGCTSSIILDQQAKKYSASITEPTQSPLQQQRKMRASACSQATPKQE